MKISEELSEYQNIVKVIKYFIETRRYGIIDRMALSISPESVEVALYDMLRLIESLRSKSIKLEVEKEIKGEKITFITTCCESGRKLGFGDKVKVVKVIEGTGEFKRGEEIECVRCPPKPSDEEINRFIESVKDNISLAREVVLLAFGSR